MESGEGKNPENVDPGQSNDEFGPMVRELIKEGGRVTQVDGKAPTKQQKQEEQNIIEESVVEKKNPDLLQ
jgi:hypothetical protein